MLSTTICTCTITKSRLSRQGQGYAGKKLLQIFFFFFLLTQICFAQWYQTNGPYGGFINCLTVSGTNLFAGTRSGGVFLSTNSGSSWVEVNNGLTNTYVNALVTAGTNIF